MTDPTPTPAPRKSLLARLSNLSPMWLAAVGIAVMLGIGGGGYYAYRTYDYVQHDNDFCMQCHLMQEPFEAFARSAHQGLGCKACHQPNIFQRSQMGLTAVIENPDQLAKHATVPNERCAECHIDGDPEKWRQIANTAGHRVHLDSKDPALQGLQCVECHSTSVHEFAPIDRTCAQSGCHEDATIQLGEMSNLTIHCAACHNFVAPVTSDAGIMASPIDEAILPGQNECLSCHVMRALVEMPAPDPHQGDCAACHNPHAQREPAEAALSCTASGCHTEPQAITPFHRGLGTGVLGGCLNCHQAHDFGLEGSDCASCHADLAPRDPAPGQASFPEFAHARHAGVSCASCHASGEEHGAVSITSIEDCRGCHHTVPVARSCERCHEPADAPDFTVRVTRAVAFSVGTSDPARTMTFPPAAHAQVDCASCHTEGTAKTVRPDLDCASCHERHHTPETDCASCHKAAPASAHPPSEGHVTCSGAGCHQNVPFEGLPRTRAFCLGCHQDLRDHEPGRRCEDCRALPAPRAPEGIDDR